jgi:hypothetical protein
VVSFSDGAGRCGGGGLAASCPNRLCCRDGSGEYQASIAFVGDRKLGGG